VLQKPISQHLITYWFVQSKNVFEEGDYKFLSLFSQLLIEKTYIQHGMRIYKREIVWVEIDEIKMNHVSQKMKDLPNRMNNYQVNAQVFKELLTITERCPTELSFVVPFYIRNSQQEIQVRQ